MTTGRAARQLSCWNHRPSGPLSPDSFIPAIEQAGLMADLTGHVLDVAFAEVAAWGREGLHLPLAVNISAHDLHNPRLADTVDMLLHLHHVPARLLTLELTETAILGSAETAGTTLTKLRELGVRISCDDFGTGNNNLTRLQQLPLSELKIDRSFVTGIVDDPRKQAIVKAAAPTR